MRRSIFFICLILITAPSAFAQQSEPLGITAISSLTQSDRLAPDGVSRLDVGRNRPRWEKAALIGAVVGGASFAVLHVIFQDWNPQPNSMAHDVAIGTLGGAVVTGGTIAFFDWICAHGSASDNAGLCTPLPTRRLHDGRRDNGMQAR
jgi:hypothetical protein